MSYRALYRVFRPQTFSEVLGQEHISTTLKNAVLSDRLAHAYLFCGPRGTGKTSSAKILAKAVNCLDLQNGEPCNLCANCKAINEERFLDVLEIDAASNRGIDEIRELRDKVRFAPSEGKCKVYIIDEVHMLTNEAFNALLKTLEEPPSFVLFILATTEAQKIPLTILSRCQRFDFRKINQDEIKNHLSEIVKEEGVKISDEALQVISRKASGGMRDAISILDQCIAFAGEEIELSHVEMVLGTVNDESAAQLLDAVIARDYSKMFSMLNTFVQQGKDMKQIMQDFTAYIRALLLLKVSNDEHLSDISGNALNIAKTQMNSVSVDYLGRMINRMSEAQRDLRFSNQPQIILEAAFVDIMLQDGNSVSVQHISQRVEDTPGLKAQKNTKKVQTSQPVRTITASDDLLLNWKEIMQEIKKQSIKLHAFLSEAKPASLENGVLILRFPYQYKFHHNSVNQEDNLRLIGQIAGKIFGIQLKVIAELENEEGHIKQELTLKDEVKHIFGDVPIEVVD